MPTSPESDAPKHLGRIVDPLAGDDPDDLPEASAESHHPVRDRLLARAREAKPQPPASRPGRAPSAPSFERPSERPFERPLGRHRRRLSPALKAFFGGLMGLAIVATLILLVMNLNHDENLSLLGRSSPSLASKQAELAAPVPTPTRSVPPPLPPGPWRIENAKNDAAFRILRGTFKNKPFLLAVQEAGLSVKQAYRVLTAFKGVRDLNRCGPNHEFIALVEKTGGTLKAFEYIESKEAVYQAKEDERGFLVGAKLDLQVRREQTSGVVLLTGTDFAAAAEKGGFDPSLRAVLAEAMQGHTSLEEIDLPASLRIIAQEVSVEGQFSRYAGIEALEIKQTGGDVLRLYYFRGERVKGYFDSKGRSFHEGGWRKPIPGAPVTSPFNPKRMHPVVRKVMPHNGTDFGAPTGEPVYAASFGIVKSVGPAGPSGNLVVVEHAANIETGYAHLSRFAEGIKPGDKVKRLQLVGYVGSTGRSTGPHLHFSVKKNGVFVDPMTLDLDGLTTLPSAERALFAETRQKYDALLEAIVAPELPKVSVPNPDPTASASAPPPAPPEETFDEGELGSTPAKIQPTPDRKSPLPNSPPPSPPPAHALPAAGPNVIYLTDSELLKLQSATDEGQVDP